MNGVLDVANASGLQIHCDYFVGNAVVIVRVAASAHNVNNISKGEKIAKALNWHAIILLR